MSKRKNKMRAVCRALRRMHIRQDLVLFMPPTEEDYWVKFDDE